MFAGIYTDPTINKVYLDNIYVPYSALSDYLASPLFSEVVSKIKPLSLCPRITEVEAEAGSTGLINDFM